MSLHNLNSREHATVLAALRYWQRHQAHIIMRGVTTMPEDAIATNSGTLEPLSRAEIDALCDRLNVLEAPYFTEKGEALADKATDGRLMTPTGRQITGTAEILSAVAYVGGASREGADGKLEFDYSGSTNVDWDGQATAEQDGQRIFVDEDGAFWLESQLHIVADAGDEEEGE